MSFTCQNARKKRVAHLWAAELACPGWTAAHSKTTTFARPQDPPVNEDPGETTSRLTLCYHGIASARLKSVASRVHRLQGPCLEAEPSCFIFKGKVEAVQWPHGLQNMAQKEASSLANEAEHSQRRRPLWSLAQNADFFTVVSDSRE